MQEHPACRACEWRVQADCETTAAAKTEKTYVTHHKPVRLCAKDTSERVEVFSLQYKMRANNYNSYCANQPIVSSVCLSAGHSPSSAVSHPLAPPCSYAAVHFFFTNAANVAKALMINNYKNCKIITYTGMKREQNPPPLVNFASRIFQTSGRNYLSTTLSVCEHQVALQTPALKEKQNFFFFFLT